MKVYKYDNFHLNLVPLDFFVAYYLMLFVLAIIESITSYAICIWFFSKKKDTTKVDKLSPSSTSRDATKIQPNTIWALSRF